MTINFRKTFRTTAISAVVIAAWLLFLPASALAADLIVSITNIRNANGFVDVTLYDHADGWLDDAHAVGDLTLAAHPGTLVAVFPHLKPGRYGVVTTHDENANGRMDFFLGLPVEGYAFSRDIRPFLSAPSFDHVAVPVGRDDVHIAIRMVYPFIGKFARTPR